MLVGEKSWMLKYGVVAGSSSGPEPHAHMRERNKTRKENQKRAHLCLSLPSHTWAGERKTPKARQLSPQA
jgi:hypothetical protein